MIDVKIMCFFDPYDKNLKELPDGISGIGLLCELSKIQTDDMKLLEKFNYLKNNKYQFFNRYDYTTQKHKLSNPTDYFFIVKESTLLYKYELKLELEPEMKKWCQFTSDLIEKSLNYFYTKEILELIK
jgi:hypothetical protein